MVSLKWDCKGKMKKNLEKKFRHRESMIVIAGDLERCCLFGESAPPLWRIRSLFDSSTSTQTAKQMSLVKELQHSRATGSIAAAIQSQGSMVTCNIIIHRSSFKCTKRYSEKNHLVTNLRSWFQYKWVILPRIQDFFVEKVKLSKDAFCFHPPWVCSRPLGILSRDSGLEGGPRYRNKIGHT